MTEKCKDKYKRRTYEGLATLTKEVHDLAKPILGVRGFAEIDILGSWNDIVGVDLAKGIMPEKLSFERDKRTNGTLYVKSAGGAFAMLFEFQKQRVIERINGFFGYPAVSQIKIRQGSLKLKLSTNEVPRTLTPVEEKSLQARIAHIEDKELRQKSYEVGRAILLKK